MGGTIIKFGSEERHIGCANLGLGDIIERTELRDGNRHDGPTTRSGMGVETASTVGVRESSTSFQASQPSLRSSLQSVLSHAGCELVASSSVSMVRAWRSRANGACDPDPCPVQCLSGDKLVGKRHAIDWITHSGSGRWCFSGGGARCASRTARSPHDVCATTGELG